MDFVVKPFFQIVCDAQVSCAKLPTDFFDLQLNCNQKWIRKRIEANAPSLENLIN